MSIKSKFCLLGLAFAAALPLHAQEATEPEQSADNMTVVRDAESGKLRAATADEQAALRSQSAKGRVRAAAAPLPLQKFHKSGARGARLTKEFLSSSVAVRKADGTLEKQCFDAHGAAEAAVQSGHIHVTQNVTPVTE